MSDGEITATLVAAVGTLFSALVLALRQRAEDWRGLYEQERADRKEHCLRLFQRVVEVGGA